MRNFFIFIILCHSISYQILAQHQITAFNGTTNGMKGSSRLTIGLGHTHVSKGKVAGETKWLALPSWTINYDYWIQEQWAIGLQSDLILESFFIESNNQELIQRKYPIALVPVAVFKPSKHLSIAGGVGAEFSKGHNLLTTRLGIEYGFHLPSNWEVGVAAVWDNKWEYYNSWGLAFTFSKIWPKARRP